MIKKKHVILFLALFLILGAAYLFITQYTPTTEPTPSALPRIPVMTFAADKVEEIQITTPSESFSFSRAENTWRLKSNHAAKIHANMMDSLCRTASAFSAFRLIENAPADLAPYGLLSPLSSVRFILADGTTHVLHVGQASPAGDGYYCKTDASDEVYLVSAGLAVPFLEPLRSYQDTTITALDQNAIKSILYEADAFTLRLSYRAPMEGKYSAAVSNWYMESPAVCDADNQKVSELFLTPLSSLHGAEIASYKAEDASAFGFSNEFVEIKTSAETITLHFGSRDDKTYVMRDRKAPIYEVGADALPFLSIKPFDVMEPLINLIPIDEVDAVSVSLPNKAAKLSILRQEGKTTYKLDDTAMEEQAFKDLYMELVGLMVDGILETSTTISTPAVGSITYHKTDGSLIEDVYYDYDALNYAVRHNGNLSFIIKKTKLSSLAEKINTI